MNSLVSVVVTTKNSEKFLENCLLSIINQKYKDVEIIVIDNNSSDKTKEIARKYTKNVFNKGPERSTQRNYGAKKAKGEYLYFLDSDMELTKNAVSECVEKIKKGVGGVITPEESFGTSYWAKCKALERSFYLGIDWMEAARFFPKKIFNKFNGYDTNMISGEDWDLSQRIEEEFKIERINSFIMHNEGDLKLLDTLRKKYYYSKKINKYASKKTNNIKFSKQSNLLERYKLFFSNPRKLFKNPMIGFGMLFMKTSEFGLGFAGYLLK